MNAQNIPTEVVTNLPQIDTSVFGMLSSADMVSKLIILMLLMASAWTWVIVFRKYSMFGVLNKSIVAFERLFWSGQPLDVLHERIKRAENDPLSSIFIEAMNEYKRAKGKNAVIDSSLKIGIKERLLQLMNLECSREIEKIENNLGFLAIVASSATFVGLFGTVWGIIHSFQSIASSQNTSLAVVAPGIAEALFVTAVGLFAAIPAIAFYNLLVSQASKTINKIDGFVVELHTILSRAIDEERL